MKANMRKKIFSISMAAVLAAFSFFSSQAASAAEIDSDGDGYGDEQELKCGYSPVNPDGVKIEKSDMDKDGLSDYWELKFKTDPLNPDSDSDGYNDGREIDYAHNPISTSSVRLSQKIEIVLAKQKMVYYVSGQPWKEFTISSGRPGMSTPKGTYKILNKVSRAWSNAYKLWMPYWMGLGDGRFGIHELPVWPSGYREGASHLGTPVSHGCVRLGVGPAKYIYERVSPGTEVIIR